MSAMASFLTTYSLLFSHQPLAVTAEPRVADGEGAVGAGGGRQHGLGRHGGGRRHGGCPGQRRPETFTR